MNYLNDIITDEDFFYDMPDCISCANDYESLIENSLKLTDGILKLERFNSEDKDNKFLFELIVNNQTIKFSLENQSDYVDSEGLITALNMILDTLDIEGNRIFCDVNGGTIDFGVAFITPEKEKELASNGLIWREQ